MFGTASAETGSLDQKDGPTTRLVATRLTGSFLATGFQASSFENLDFFYCRSCHALVIQDVGARVDDSLGRVATNAKIEEGSSHRPPSEVGVLQQSGRIHNVSAAIRSFGAAIEGLLLP